MTAPLLLVYQLLFPLVGVFVLLKFLFGGRGRSLLEARTDIRQRCGLLSGAELAALRGDGTRPTLWLHAASAGEVAACAPLIERVAASPGRPRVLLTTSTVTGRERGRKAAGVDLCVLAPMDLYPAVSAFLGRARPASLVLVETELWPMTLRLARRRGVRLGLANGRMTVRAHRRYRLIRPLMARVLAGFERAALQTQGDVERFVSLGLRPEAAACAGNMKYDLPLPSEESRRLVRAAFERLGWGRDPRWTAGSTRPGEETAVVSAHQLAAVKVPGLRLVLVPRHVERCDEVLQLLRTEGIRTIRWSQIENDLGAPIQGSAPTGPTPECLLVDRMGLLAPLYAESAAAFVGGTLVPVGGHNLLEPALCGVPVLFGPYFSSIQDVAEALGKSGGGSVVVRSQDIAAALVHLLHDEREHAELGARALETARSFAGATGRTWEHLRPLLETRPE